MYLNEIRDNYGASTKKKVLGRGIGSGLGKTSGKGHKGQKARGFGKVRLGFEGGQNPIYRRLPKRGFNNKVFANNYYCINLVDLNKMVSGGIISSSDVVSYELLIARGIINSRYDGLKILGKGELKTPLNFLVNKISKSAVESITGVGGKVNIVDSKKFMPTMYNK